MVVTTRLSGGKGGRNALEAELRRLGVAQKNARPNHPTTCGKVERFQQTLNKWLAAQPDQPSTVAERQALLDAFTDEDNHRQPHRSLPHRATPTTVYASLPKAQPTASRDADTHDRVRHDRIDDSGCVTLRVAGRLHHSASAEPTPEPTSSCLSRTCTSAWSTPPPGSCSASWSSTPPRTTSPPEHPKAPSDNDHGPNPQPWVQTVADALRDHTTRRSRILANTSP